MLRQDTFDEQPALAAITARLRTGSSYNLGTDIENIIAEHTGEPRCGVDGPDGWVCDEPADHQPGNTHAAKHGGAWKGGVRPAAG